MNFLFGPSTSPSEDAFYAQDSDTPFHYKVEYGNNGVEDIIIKDTLGRFVPIHVSALYQLMNILADISHKQVAVTVYNELTSNTHTNTKV